MPNDRYIQGRLHEYAVKAKYEKQNYQVTRAASSHGTFDLICIRPEKFEDISGQAPFRFDGHIVLIQCKTGKSAKRELKKLRDSDIKSKFEGIYRVTVSFE